MNKLPKLLVCDIDGTLAPFNANLGLTTRYILERFHNLGVRIGLASGRPLYQIKQSEVFYNLSFDFDLFIMMNGASYYDNNTKDITYINTMNKNTVKSIIELMKPYEVNCNCCFYTKDEMIVRNNDEWMQEHWYKDRKDIRVEKDDAYYYQENREKLMYRFYKPEYLEVCMSELNKKSYNDFIYFKTQPDHLEFANISTDKKYALMDYCKKHNIDLEDVCACGDTSNDNGMIITAGVGVCLKNGSIDTKEISDYVTEKPVDEDGLGLCLKEIYKEYL